jgi:Arc/MetJ family transcription regulator
MIAKAIKRYRLGAKREMVMLGIQQMLKIAFTPKREKSLSLEEVWYIQPGDNLQSRSADSGQCVGNRLPDACCGYTP